MDSRDAAPLPYGEYVPVGRSALVRRVVALPVRVRRTLGVNDYVIGLVDSLVTICAIALEETDLPILQRLSDADHEFAIIGQDPDWIATALQYASEPVLADWAQRLQRADHQRVLNQLLGTAGLHSMRREAERDTRIVLTAAQVGMRFLGPWALAMDDALGTLTEAQRHEIGLTGKVGSSLFGLALNADAVIGTSLSSSSGIAFPEDIQAVILEPAEVASAVDQFRDVLRARSDENLAGLGDVFIRKIRGARDALEHSADGVSQAANSLVELIDRIAREAFSERDVLQWLDDNGLDMTYQTPEGRRRPNKRAQLLCLAWAGARVKAAAPGTWDLPKIAAYALVNIRDNLQKLKHADEDSAEERELLSRLLDAIEATTLLMVRAAWATVGPEHVETLRAQLSA